MGISLDSSFPDPFCFFSGRSFRFERERLYQRVQFIYIHSSLSFLAPSYLRSLSIADFNADGTRFLGTSVADGGTVADTSPSFSSTGQDESTSGAGVVQVVTDAPEISSVLPPSMTTTTATASTAVVPPTTTETTEITTATTNTATTSTSTPTTTTTTAFVSDLDPREGSTSTSDTATWWSYVGWGSIPTSSESAGVVPTMAAGQKGVEAEGGVVGVEVDVNEEVGVPPVRGVGPEGEEATESGEQPQEDVVHATGEGVSDNAVSDSPKLPATSTTWLTPWTWYYPSTPTNVEVHSDAEKVQHAAAAAVEEEERVMHRHGDADADVKDLQRDFPPSGAQPATAGLSSDITTTTDASSPNGVHAPSSQIPDPLINSDPNPVASTITSHTSGWASFFSSRSLMVKTLGYGSVPVGLIEDSVKRDENGVEVMDLDDGEGDEIEGDNLGIGIGGERGRDVHRKESGGGAPTVEDVAGAGAVFKANAKRTKNRIVSSAPLSAVSTAAAANPTAKTLVSSAPPTPKKGNSGTSTPTLGPSPSTSVSNKQQPISPSTSTSTNDTLSKPSTISSTPTPIPPTNIKPVSSPTPTKPTPTNKSTSKSRTSSPSPSKKSISIPPAPPPPNLVLPTWDDTFYTAPRDVLPQVEEARADARDQWVGGKLLGRTMRFMSSVLCAKDGVVETMRGGSIKGKEKENDDERPRRVRDGSADTARRTGSVGVGGGGGGESLVERDRRERFREFGRELPKAWAVLEGGGGRRFAASRSRSRVSSSSSSLSSLSAAAQAKGKASASAKQEEADKTGLHDVLRGCRRVVVIGVHGWVPGAMIRSVLGEVSVFSFSIF